MSGYILIFILITILCALLYALRQLLLGNHHSLSRSLFLRAGISIGLLVFVICAYYFGWLQPSEGLAYL